LGNDDLKELKEDIKQLDDKISKSEENTNKRLEKIENNMMKFTDSHNKSMTKMTEVISDIKIMLAKDYCEKKDLDKLEETLTDKIDENNKNRKKDIKDLDLKIDNLDVRIDDIEKNNAIDIPTIVKYTLFFIFSTSFGYLFSIVFK